MKTKRTRRTRRRRKKRTTPTNHRSCASRTKTRLRLASVGVIVSPMSWDAEDVALLKKLWAVGQSAAQIARRLGCSRSAVCAKLTRLGLKRSHKPPTAKPKIRPVPKRKPALLAACRVTATPETARDLRGALSDGPEFFEQCYVFRIPTHGRCLYADCQLQASLRRSVRYGAHNGLKSDIAPCPALCHERSFHNSRVQIA